MENTPAFLIQRVENLLAHVRAELNRPWTAAELCERVGLSESHFRRACIRITGEPPMRYLKRLRLEAAGHLLCTTALSVKEVANAVGCADVSHFVRDFRRVYGESPSAFRRSTVTSPLKDPSPALSVFANE